MTLQDLHVKKERRLRSKPKPPRDWKLLVVIGNQWGNSVIPLTIPYQGCPLFHTPTTIYLRFFFFFLLGKNIDSMENQIKRIKSIINKPFLCQSFSDF
jgi:hypothetical protein